MKNLQMDAHSVRAAELFGVDLDKVTDEQRRAGKAAKFAEMYSDKTETEQLATKWMFDELRNKRNADAVDSMIQKMFTEDEIMPFDGPAPWDVGVQIGLSARRRMVAASKNQPYTVHRDRHYHGLPAMCRNKLWAFIYTALYLETYYEKV